MEFASVEDQVKQRNRNQNQNSVLWPDSEREGEGGRRQGGWIRTKRGDGTAARAD